MVSDLDLGAYVFTADRQAGFTALSGDRNPIHVDPLYARRQIAGGLTVHGVHLLLVGLELYVSRRAAEGKPVQSWAKLRAKFQSFAGVGQELRYTAREETAGAVRLQARSGARVILSASLVCAGAPEGSAPLSPAPVSFNEPPADLSLTDLAGRVGSVPLGGDAELARSMFPALVQNFSLGFVFDLLAATRLVGMVCPGLHSIFTGLQFKRAPRADGDGLQYRVIAADDRLALVELAVIGGMGVGTLQAFVRPSAQVQASLAEARRLVVPGEFASQQALVIGGSRGLGEVTSKLLAAGGASVIITYRVGEAEAKRVQQELISAGAVCDVVPCDVNQPEAIVAEFAARPPPTHLYYFATPKIPANWSGRFDGEAFALLGACYVTAGARLLEAVRTVQRGPLALFYPSTAFLDAPEPGFAEYEAAKGAGEAWARHAERQDPALFASCVRLPRLATDQTATLSGPPAPDAGPPMLDALRTFHRSAHAYFMSAGPGGAATL